MSSAGLCVALLWAAIGAPRPARAFTEPRTYYADPTVGGGGGRWFTGSLAEGYACSVCHEPAGSETLELSGLPENGYTPGASYELRIAWPAFAARARALREADAEPASMSLVAEFVAETGQGAGTLELRPAEDAEPGALCAFPEGAQATQLFRVRPGEEVREAQVRCVAEALGQRCVFAVLSCGAEEVRVRWTVPDDAAGVIWLSAGFVATEEVSGDPSGDAVTEVSVAVLPAGSGAEHATRTLQSGCAVRTPGARGLPVLQGFAWACAALAGLGRARRRRARA